MKTYSAIVLVLLWSIPSLVITHVSQATVYHLTDIGHLPSGSDSSQAFAINNLGQVAGTGVMPSVADSITHAFLWTSANGIQDLGPGAGDSSNASGINANGLVSGFYYTDAADGTVTGQHGVVWTSAGNFQEIGNLPGDDSSNAFAINVNGQVAGLSKLFSAKFIEHPVVWSALSGMQNLGSLPGGNGSGHAVAINDSGQVAGTAVGAHGSHAFRWSSTSGMQDLGALPGPSNSSDGWGINSLGDVVGDSLTIGGGHAFLWRSTTGMQDLGTIPGFNESFAEGVNSSDVVVGNAFNTNAPGATAFRAIVWTTAGGMKDLNNMLDSSGAGWTLTGAQAVNDAGQITGFGRDPNGATHAVLLTPVPEPSAIGLAIITAASLAVCRRRPTSRSRV